MNMDDSLSNLIVEYECGTMSEEDVPAFMQKLIDSGDAWKLQGHFGRMAIALIEAGICHHKIEPIKSRNIFDMIKEEE
jgi:hypothetical protein